MENWFSVYGPYCDSNETYVSCRPQIFCRGDLVVPSSIDGLQVVGLSYHAFVMYKDINRDEIVPNKLITSVFLPEGIKYIDEGAFAMCENLTSIQLPSTMKQIVQKSFWGCKQLQSVNFPQGIERIGDFAFKDCNLSALHFERHNVMLGAGVFEENNNLKDIYCSREQKLHTANFVFSYGCPKIDYSSITIHCYKDSPAYDFATQNGCLVSIVD